MAKFLNLSCANLFVLQKADVAGGSMMPGDKWRIGSSHQELDIIR